MILPCPASVYSRSTVPSRVSILVSLKMCLNLSNLAITALGTVIGLVFGAIPGLTYMTGILLVLPMTYGMDISSAISILPGIYCGGMTGGSVSAILLGIPGTPSAAVQLSAITQKFSAAARCALIFLGLSCICSPVYSSCRC